MGAPTEKAAEQQPETVEFSGVSIPSALTVPEWANPYMDLEEYDPPSRRDLSGGTTQGARLQR